MFVMCICLCFCACVSFNACVFLFLYEYILDQWTFVCSINSPFNFSVVLTEMITDDFNFINNVFGLLYSSF